jgi:DNA-binding IclR family transcriptional regulator
MLRFLASQPEPVALDHIARAIGIPRSSAYHLVNAMVDEGFVTHVEDEHRYGLGVSAFEVGSGYARHAPLQRLARRPLADLVDAIAESGHLAVLHGREVFYVLEERATRRPPLVSDVGVRLPAQITASGRAILASLPAAQVRALFPDRASFVHRHAEGPTSLSALTSLLAETRQRGYATEDGEVTPGLSSVAVPVLDHVAHPVAAVAVTYESARVADVAGVVRRVRATADVLTRRLGGRPRENLPDRTRDDSHIDG